MLSVWYTALQSGINLVSLLQLLLGLYFYEEKDYTHWTKDWWGSMATITNGYFFFDMLASFVIIGCREVSKTKKVLFLELVLQIIAFKAMILYWSPDFRTSMQG